MGTIVTDYRFNLLRLDVEEKRQTTVVRITHDDGIISRVAYTPCWLNDRMNQQP